MNDNTPHGVIVEINWSVHEGRHDGSYDGGAKEEGRQVVVFVGENRDKAKINSLAFINELIERMKQDGSADGQPGTRFGESQVRRIAGPLDPHSEVFRVWANSPGGEGGQEESPESGVSG